MQNLSQPSCTVTKAVDAPWLSVDAGGIERGNFSSAGNRCVPTARSPARRPHSDRRSCRAIADRFAGHHHRRKAARDDHFLALSLRHASSNANNHVCISLLKRPTAPVPNRPFQPLFPEYPACSKSPYRHLQAHLRARYPATDKASAIPRIIDVHRHHGR